MNIFEEDLAVILIIIGGGINWGLIGLFSFDAVAWLLGGSGSLLSRAVQTVVGIAALCAIPSLFLAASGRRRRRGVTPRAFSLFFRLVRARRVHKTRLPGGPSPRQRASAAVFRRSNFSESLLPGRDFQSISRAAHSHRNPTFGI